MMFRHGLEYEPVFTTPSQLVLHGLNPWNQVLETVNTWSFHHQVFLSDFVSVELQHHWIDIPSSTKRKVGITKPELWWSLDARYLASSTVSPSWNGMGDCKLNQRKVFFVFFFRRICFLGCSILWRPNMFMTDDERQGSWIMSFEKPLKSNCKIWIFGNVESVDNRYHFSKMRRIKSTNNDSCCFMLSWIRFGRFKLPSFAFTLLGQDNA